MKGNVEGEVDVRTKREKVREAALPCRGELVVGELVRVVLVKALVKPATGADA